MPTARGVRAPKLLTVKHDGRDVAFTDAQHIAIGETEPHRDEQTRRLSLPVTGGMQTLAEALRRLSGSAIEVLDIGLRRPDLDDVFLTLTGHAAEDAEPSGDSAGSPTTVSAGAAR